MSAFRPTKCACEKCRLACQHKPCWLTPDEARAIEKAHPGMTAVDTSAFLRGRPVRITRMRIVGEAPGSEHFNAVGPCVFYDAGRCALHYTELKPREGRLSSHQLSRMGGATLRAQIAATWL